MKRVFGFFCLTIFLFNLSFVHLQTSEAAENTRWKVSQMKLQKQMKQKETTPLELSRSEFDLLTQSTQYKNKLISKLMRKSSDIQQTPAPRPQFTSFLSINRPWMDQDEPKRFFKDESYTTNIHNLPTVGNTTIQGWSGSYWPMRNGEISVRYNKNDKNTIGVIDPQSGNYLRYFVWGESISMYAQPAEHNSLFNTPDFSKYVDENYSPAEKYDLLVGDYDYTLTNFLKNEGAKYAYGNDVVGWFGICHGWAPASYYYPQPSRSVSLLTENGMTIRFLPDDIKGLVSLFWANAQFQTLFVGNRCEYYYPNPGWFTSPNCISLSPASFIMIIANHVGLLGKNLIYEPSADPEIWNNPIRSYEMRYYNVLNNEFSGNAASVKIPIEQLRGSNDSFLRYVADSNPKAAYAVGVFVKTTHTLFTQITDLVHGDSTAENKADSKEYDAILELDENDNIIGGEWKYKDHPNFIWRHDPTEPVQGASDKEYTTFAWRPDLKKLAQNASNKGQPLKAIVEYLVNSSA